MSHLNQLVIHLARIDTCSVCNNDGRVRVNLVHHNQSGVVPCPLCSDPSALGAWLAPFLEAESA